MTNDPKFVTSDGSVFRVDFLSHEPGHCVIAMDADGDQRGEDKVSAYCAPTVADLRLLAAFLLGVADQLERDARDPKTAMAVFRVESGDPGEESPR